MENISEVKGECYKFFFMDELVLMIQHNRKVWNWNAHDFVKDEKFLAFKVTRSIFQGHVVIGLNALDLFDIFLTDESGYIIKKIESIYAGMLIYEIDVEMKHTRL
jgi:hypothetical protein